MIKNESHLISYVFLSMILTEEDNIKKWKLFFRSARTVFRNRKTMQANFVAILKILIARLVFK